MNTSDETVADGEHELLDPALTAALELLKVNMRLLPDSSLEPFARAIAERREFDFTLEQSRRENGWLLEDDVPWSEDERPEWRS